MSAHHGIPKYKEGTTIRHQKSAKGNAHNARSDGDPISLLVSQNSCLSGGGGEDGGGGVSTCTAHEKLLEEERLAQMGDDPFPVHIQHVGDRHRKRRGDLACISGGGDLKDQNVLWVFNFQGMFQEFFKLFLVCESV